MLETLRQGGITMIPLLLCSIISLAVSLERLIYLKRAKGDNFRLIKKVKLMIDNRKIGEAKSILQEARGPVAGMLLEGIKYYGKKKYEIQDYLEIVGNNQLKKLEKRLRVLDFIATVSPLLGLLGTVLGIIDSFNILAGADSLSSPGAISVGISQALISTAVGLIVAIPTMMMYTYLVSLVEARAEEMNRWTLDLVEILSQGGSNVQF
ncbi:MotA/TolQ/ExbB proton channel family protein [Natroniella sulfidigena]|uniref:MotA/TolQ/ExbB proton channel family protein n=1 Tax=Natroniella sulfidigena TaxID=723921 RepID=UPI00200ACF75|nr:MotA/TolQ/ExbB proton channel family protein [Natroniella sulfidigena]MCK8817700.1 MotA/TolQ/ExbB proton channel family protein [Natroniella sulfidigena]